MSAMSMVQALNSAIDVMLDRDPDVVIFGEDVGFYGGVFRVTEGLQKKHGDHRVFDAPIAEGGMLGTAVGMGAYGLLPISAIEDDDPVVFFEPKRLYNGPFDGHPDRPAVPWTQHPHSEVPAGYYTVPLGQAAVVLPGDAVTVLAYGTMVHVALAAAEE